MNNVTNSRQLVSDILYCSAIMHLLAEAMDTHEKKLKELKSKNTYAGSAAKSLYTDISDRLAKTSVRLAKVTDIPFEDYRGIVDIAFNAALKNLAEQCK